MTYDTPRSLTLTVPGDPSPFPRPRVYKGRAVSVKADHPAKAYRDRVYWTAMAAMAADRTPFKAPILSVMFRYPFAGTVRKTKPNPRRPHRAKGDLDNLMKGLKDGLERAGVVANDSHIWGYDAVIKVRGEPHEPPCTIIVVREMHEHSLATLAAMIERPWWGDGEVPF